MLNSVSVNFYLGEILGTCVSTSSEFMDSEKVEAVMRDQS